MSDGGSVRRLPGAVALIGSYPPRRCGIATFTSDLRSAISDAAGSTRCYAVAMTDVPEGYDYSDEVRFEVQNRSLPDYRLAADFLNMNQVEAVCVQHEYGIYGGDNGVHLFALLNGLRMPVVTTLHTVLSEPRTGQKLVLRELAHVSDRLVVMSEKGREILRAVYDVPVEKISCIPHGIPDFGFVDPNFFKDQFGVEGRKVILTFGLLSPGKGIEHMIDALPEIVARNPDAVYIVLGATHPNVRRSSGEAYRLSLQRRARELGVDRHVVFHNRFVDAQELWQFLGAADVYVTPYLNREQITSGTLAYALGAGKPIVSTPYWHAEELLADGRGRLVPFRDPAALAREVNDLFEDEVERHAIRRRAYAFARDMIWKQVGRGYLDLFFELIEERRRRPRPAFSAKTVRSSALEVPPITFAHLRRMTDDVGVLQHCRGTVPAREHGYCTDDNARALLAVVKAQDLVGGREPLQVLGTRYMSFLWHAFDSERARFRNFLGYDRRWREAEGSEDSHGRALWSLGHVAALDTGHDLADVAAGLFERALPSLLEFSSPRAWAFGLLGLDAYLERFGGDIEARRVRERVAERLLDLYRRHGTPEWPWPEELLAYDNAKIPHALLAAGFLLDRDDMRQTGLRSLDWLAELQIDERGHFVPIGNRGWYCRGGDRARFDQQPLEAQSMLESCLFAHQISFEDKWTDRAQVCLEWFLGRNDTGDSLFDHRSGGCRDGLGAGGANVNQGAESTLSWLLALIDMNRDPALQLLMRRPGATDRPVEVPAGPSPAPDLVEQESFTAGASPRMY